MGETVYNRILSHVIRSPIFHQLFYSFFSAWLSSERTNVAPSLSYCTKCVKMLISFLFSPISLLDIAENNWLRSDYQYSVNNSECIFEYVLSLRNHLISLQEIKHCLLGISSTVLEVNYSPRKKEERQSEKFFFLTPKNLDFLFLSVMSYQYLKSNANKNFMQYAKDREGNLGVTVCFHYLHLGKRSRAVRN